MTLIIISGIMMGTLYGMVSIGLSLVYGTLKLFNFSHGSLMTIGAYIAWTSYQKFDNIWLCVILTLFIMFIFGIILERLIIEPFLDRKNISLIAVITTLAGIIFLDNSVNIIWGPRLKQLPQLIYGSFVISYQEIFIIVLAPVLLIMLGLFLKYHKIGCAIRAVEQNREFSLLVGIRVNQIYRLTFALAALFAAMAGIMMGTIRFITPMMGTGYLVKALIIVILGGMGSMYGTLVSAYILGIVEAFSMYYFGLYWTPSIVFLLLIMILIIKPEGIFGRK